MSTRPAQDIGAERITTRQRAHTILTVFAAIEAILKSSALDGCEPATVQKILSICKAEQQRQLCVIDKARAAASKVDA